MHTLSLHKYDESLLHSARIISSDKGFFKSYELRNGKFMKVFKSFQECLAERKKPDFFQTYLEIYETLLRKLQMSERIESSYVNLPSDVYLDGTHAKSYAAQGHFNYLDLINHLEGKTLEEACAFFGKLTLAIQELNEQGVVLPDLCNYSNILCNPITGDFTLIDYDGFQVGDYASFTISDALHNDVLNVEEYDKFYNKKTYLYSPEIDKLSLILLFLDLITGYSIRNFGDKIPQLRKDGKSLTIDNIHAYAKRIGIADTMLENELFNILFSTSSVYPGEAIKSLAKTHYINSFGCLEKR